MTALQLLSYICAALLIQFTIATGVAAWRWRRSDRLPALPAIEAGDDAEAPAWPGLREFRVLRRQFEDALRTQCSFQLVPVDGVALPPFLAGQFLTFALDIPHPSGGTSRPVMRCYSVSEAPRPGSYRITVKRVPPPPDRPALPPGLASNHLHDRVREGDLLRVKAPAGYFSIDADVGVPAVFIAGGIGITPMMSMLTWCLEQQPTRALYLYYGLRHGGEHAFKASLEALAAAHPTFHLNVVYSQPALSDVLGRDHQHTGHVDLALLRQTLPHGRHAFYICGPPAMMASLVPGLIEWGIPPQDIHYEAFGPASPAPLHAASNRAAHSATIAVDVQFRRSGRTLVWSGQDASLLDFAERHGIAVESGCRSGSCGSCEMALVAGSVCYAVAPDRALATGRCLLCVGTPGSALVLDA